MTHKLSRFPPSLGSDAAPVWCHPRRPVASSATLGAWEGRDTVLTCPL